MAPSSKICARTSDQIGVSLKKRESNYEEEGEKGTKAPGLIYALSHNGGTWFTHVDNVVLCAHLTVTFWVKYLMEIVSIDIRARSLVSIDRRARSLVSIDIRARSLVSINSRCSALAYPTPTLERIY